MIVSFPGLLYCRIGPALRWSLRGWLDALEQPSLVRSEHGCDPSPHLYARFTISVDDLAQCGLVHAQHLCQTVLPDARLPQLQLKIGVHANSLDDNSQSSTN